MFKNINELRPESIKQLEILFIIGRWKIINLPTLQKHLSFKIAYRTLKAKVLVLEKEELLEGIFLGDGLKYIYLTSDGFDLTPFKGRYELDHNSSSVDLLKTNILQKFKEYSYIEKTYMDYELTAPHLIGAVDISIKGNSDHFLIDYELTRITVNSARNKISEHFKIKGYQNSIFFFSSYPRMHIYLKALEFFTKEAQERFFFIVDEKLLTGSSKIDDLEAYHLNEKLELSCILGPKWQ